MPRSAPCGVATLPSSSSTGGHSAACTKVVTKRGIKVRFTIRAKEDMFDEQYVIATACTQHTQCNTYKWRAQAHARAKSNQATHKHTTSKMHNRYDTRRVRRESKVDNQSRHAMTEDSHAPAATQRPRSQWP